MKLSRLIAALPAPRVANFAERDVAGVTDDSREVQPGWLFIAVRGASVDGHKFAAHAADLGACAIVCEQECAGAAGLPQIIVADSRAAAADVGAEFFGHPSRSMAVAAVTGTDGKSSTALLAAGMARAAGKRVGVVGTIAYEIDDRTLPAQETTPGSVRLQSLLAQMCDAGVDMAFMEASSHGLDQGRLRSIRLAAGIHTVVTRDHLDYHGDLDSYKGAKAKLFEAIDPAGVAVLNADDPTHELFAAATPARIVRYSIARDADYRATVTSAGLDGSRFRLDTPSGSIEVATPLVGQHNVQNCLSAAACVHALGIDVADVKAGIEATSAVPGRLERVSRDGEPTVLVDYAHTPHALQAVIRTLRDLAPARIIVVFGCGGDRDKGKRPEMGAVVTEAADVAWVTSDNPRSEEPEAIIADIMAGVERKERCRVEPDRRLAIEGAVAEARAEDMVLVAGKGHESRQIFKDHVVPFSDVEVARQVLDKRAT